MKVNMGLIVFQQVGRDDAVVFMNIVFNVFLQVIG